MEGERILQKILKGESRLWQDLKNYTAPLERILVGDNLKHIAKKSTDYEKFCKYGTFCMKLLRYCIEAFSKERKQQNGNNIQEDCFKCAILGADMLSKLVTSGVPLPSEISMSGVTKLFFHLIVSALKENSISNLLPITQFLINITQAAMLSGQNNIIKDSAGLCKQISDHLWNAAIKLSKSMDKQQRALLALSLREKSIDLLIVAELDLYTILERGLQTGKQFQVEVNGSSERQEGQTFLLNLLSKVIALLDKRHIKNVQVYSRLEDLCITCCKLSHTSSYIHELLKSFNHLLSKEMQNSANSSKRFSVVQCVIQVLLCTLCIRLKEEKELQNHQYDINLKWKGIQTRLDNTSESLRSLNINLYGESQILLAINYIRYVFSKICTSNGKDSDKLVKIPEDVLCSLCDILLVCHNIQCDVMKFKMTSDKCMINCNTWEIIIQPKLAMLYLISTVLLKTLSPQNGRKTVIKCNYNSIMTEGMNMLNGIVEEFPVALEQYIHYAYHTFNVGAILFNCGHLNDATSLARLSCQAALKWYIAKSHESDAFTKVALYKKFELLSNCLAKQGFWLESIHVMNICCQCHILSLDDCNAINDVKASKYVIIWSNRKQNVMKQMNDVKTIMKLERCNLDEKCKDFKGPSLYEEQICIMLKMELESYRKKGYCLPSSQLCVVEKLLNVYTSCKDETNSALMRLEKVKIMQYMAMQSADVSSCISDGLHNCEQLIKDVNEMLKQQPESIMVKDMLASVYFWRFILQYSLATQQTKESCSDLSQEDELTCSDATNSQCEKVNFTNIISDFLPSLHSAVKIWTELIIDGVKAEKKLDVYSKSESCWMLQIASSVYSFINMPLSRIHSLLVLAKFASHCGENENLQTAVVANSLAIQALCDKGNIYTAELLKNECEEIISRLDDELQVINKYVFLVAKSQLFLCKGLYHEGWQLVKSVLEGAKSIVGTTILFVCVKAKLLCVRYLALPASVCKTYLGDADCFNYFEYLSDSAKNAEALLRHFVDNSTGTEFAGVNDQKKDRAVFVSHWSLLSQISYCFMELGKIYLRQGAVREARRFLKDGKEITRRFLSANRFSEFTLQMAQLNIFVDNAEQCKSYLEAAMSILMPDITLSDIVDELQPLRMDRNQDNCAFASYENISLAQLQIHVLICYCHYLKITGNVSNVRKVISLSHDLRKFFVNQYEQVLDNLEPILAVIFWGKDGQLSGESTVGHIGKGKAKAKSKRSKTAVKRNENQEFIPCKADMASLVFLECGLKIYSLDGDNALQNGDYPAMLSNVKTGLNMVQVAQEVVNDPFLLDVMSISLLHYLQGVAHVLASKDGFDSWRVAGSLPPSDVKNENVADVSEIMSKLDLSVSVEEITGKKSRRKIKYDEEYSDPSCDENFVMDEPTPVVNKTRKRGRGGKNITIEPSSVIRSKKTSSRRAATTKTPLAVEIQGDLNGTQTEKEIEGRKNCNRSCRKNSKDIKSASKLRRNGKRNILRDNGDSEIQGNGGKDKDNGETHKNRKNLSRDLIKQCDQNELSEQNGVEIIEEEDADMKNALDSFNTSLKYLHPCCNPLLLTRVCHALLLCYGLRNPEKAAVYQNIAMATTLRHQTLNRSSQKIRKQKSKQGKVRLEGDSELLKSMNLETLTDDDNESTKQMLQLESIKNAVDFVIFNGDVMESFKTTIDLLPEDLTVCTLSIVQAPDRENVKHLVITRLRKSCESLVLKLTLPNEEDEGDCMEQEFQTSDSVVRDLSSIFRRSILSDFTAIMRHLSEINKIESKREWWSRREHVDNQLKSFVKRMEETWFGRWRGILNGRRLDVKDRSRLQSHMKKINEIAVNILGRPIQNEQLLEVLTDSFCHLQPNEVMNVLAELTGMQIYSSQLVKFSTAVSKFLDDNESVDNATGVKRGPVVLIVDKDIQHLPLEAMPILRNQEVSRMPSLQFINAHLSLQNMKMSGVNTTQTFYVLNPHDNLPRTEKKFSDWFSREYVSQSPIHESLEEHPEILQRVTEPLLDRVEMRFLIHSYRFSTFRPKIRGFEVNEYENGWKGVVGRAPSVDEFKDGLANHELFIYMGHGNGREFLNGDEITRLYCQAVALIMGCSSGKLIVEGQCEARGMALNYLLSGSPTVVGNLWDVTDVDIDKFTAKLLELWFQGGLSLTQCVTESRQYCKMKYINGFAPIVYGMPVYTRTLEK